MARIAGVNIPQNKVLHVALTYIHGIGKKYSNDICKKLNVDGHVINLKRINSEPFSIKKSISIKDFLKLYEKNDWKNFFLPIYSVLNKIKYVGK